MTDRQPPVRDSYPHLASWLAGVRLQGLQLDAMEVEVARIFREVASLREANGYWMNGVADAVEWLGYNREAACGPADLLPGLVTLLALTGRHPS